MEFKIANYEVGFETTKKIIKDYMLDFTNKKVLLVGPFNSVFVNMVKDYTDKLFIINPECDSPKEALIAFNYNCEYELDDKEFDIIMVAVHGGKSGRSILERIVKEFEFNECIALHSMEDCTNSDIWRHIDINTADVFVDPTTRVIEEIIRLRKIPSYFLSLDEFKKYCVPKLIK